MGSDAIPDGPSAALAGIQRGTSRMHRAAHVLANEGVDVASLLELQLGESQVAASTAAVRAIDDAMGTLIDELA